MVNVLHVYHNMDFVGAFSGQHIVIDVLLIYLIVEVVILQIFVILAWMVMFGKVLQVFNVLMIVVNKCLKEQHIVNTVKINVYHANQQIYAMNAKKDILRRDNV